MCENGHFGLYLACLGVSQIVCSSRGGGWRERKANKNEHFLMGGGGGGVTDQKQRSFLYYFYVGNSFPSHKKFLQGEGGYGRKRTFTWGGCVTKTNNEHRGEGVQNWKI